MAIPLERDDRPGAEWALLLFDRNPQPMWVLDRETLAFLAINQAAAAQYGYSREEFLRMTVADVCPPDDVPALAHLEGLARHRRKDGSIIVVSVVGTALDFGGRPAYLAAPRDVTAQVRTEEALRLSEARLRAVIEHGSDGFALLAADGTVLDTSALGARILGVPRDEIVGKPRADVLHPDDAHAARSFERVAAQPGCSEPTLHRVRHADGSWRWIEGLFTNLLDDPAVGAVVFNYRDVTDRKHAQERLALQAQLIETMRDAVISTDADKRVTSWNPAAEAMYGWKAEEVLGRPASDVIPSDLTEIQREGALRALAETGHWSSELTQKRRDGSPIRVEGLVIARRDAAGRPTGYVAVNRDLGERHAVQQALRKSEQRFALFMDHLPGAAFIKDDRGRYVYMNDTCRRVLGVGSDWGGRTGEELAPAELERQFREADDRVRATRAAVQVVDRVPLTPAGGDWLVTKFPIPDPAGGCMVGGIAIDITERQRADEALRQSEQRYRDLFEQNVAGVFRTSLDGAILEANDAGARMFGFTSAEEFRKQDAHGFWRDLRDRASMIERLKAGPVLEELPMRRLDGPDIAVLGRVRLVLDARGAAVGLQATLIDITERKRVEQALQQSEERAKVLLNAMPDLMFRLDRDGVFLDYKAEKPDLYVQSEDTIIGKRNRDISPPEFGDLVEHYINATLTAGGMQIFEYQLPIPGRGLRAYEARMVVSGADEVTAIVRDITERKQAEEERDRLLEELRGERQRLEALSRRLVGIQEEERRAIARELHDQIGQLLTGLKLLAESGRGRDELLEVVSELMDRVRSLSLDLRPPMLDNLGLVPALLWHVDRYATQTGVRVDFRELGHRRRYSSDTEIAAFRIVQEALTNVARHARVQEASIEVEAGDERLRLRVEDQGSGFDPRSQPGAAGVGLTGMQERARLLGGRVSIDTRPGRGTRVEAELPVTDRGPAA